MLNYKNYFNDLLNINTQYKFHIGFKTKKTLSRITDTLSDKHNTELYKLYNKYKKTKDIQLQLECDYIKQYNEKKIYLYFLINSHSNIISEFEYETNNVYPNKYKLQRQKDFHKCINTIIERLKEAMKLNITIPKIICRKFIKQIKTYKEYRYFYIFLKKYYLPKCRNTIGLYDLPNGKEIYKLFIKNTLGSINKTPEEIHKLGLSLLPTELSNHPNEDTYKSRKELLDDCKKYAIHIYNHIIPKYFYYKPDEPFIIKEVPISLENSMSLAYYSPNEDAVFINLSYYSECNKNALYSLLMHECFHQYHYRFMNFIKLEKYQIYGYDNLALIEGFAHYMEIYCDNYDDNNEFSLLRKVRLVIDTGINYYKWSYKKSYKFMNKYLPNKVKDTETELERYICNPSQALCYTIGKIEIIKLRDLFLQQNKGTIKDFHQKLLENGTVSFSFLEKNILS
jgi:uncharacterized protein (DUF885 family)